VAVLDFNRAGKANERSCATCEPIYVFALPGGAIVLRRSVVPRPQHLSHTPADCCDIPGATRSRRSSSRQRASSDDIALCLIPQAAVHTPA
jgi:hypothetical protein